MRSDEEMMILIMCVHLTLLFGVVVFIVAMVGYEDVCVVRLTVGNLKSSLLKSKLRLMIIGSLAEQVI